MSELTSTTHHLEQLFHSHIHCFNDYHHPVCKRHYW